MGPFIFRRRPIQRENGVVQTKRRLSSVGSFRPWWKFACPCRVFGSGLRWSGHLKPTLVWRRKLASLTKFEVGPFDTVINSIFNINYAPRAPWNYYRRNTGPLASLIGPKSPENGKEPVPPLGHAFNVKGNCVRGTYEPLTDRYRYWKPAKIYLYTSVGMMGFYPSRRFLIPRIFGRSPVEITIH